MTDTARTVVSDLPWWAWVVLAAALAIRTRSLLTQRWRRQDPQRWFDPTQRRVGRSRAGGRCEYTRRWVWWHRCPNLAQEADHFRPWSRGGATTLENMVAACTRHNQAKGGRAPAAITRWVIAWRRKGYFPDGVRRRPGAWYRASILARARRHWS